MSKPVIHESMLIASRDRIAEAYQNVQELPLIHAGGWEEIAVRAVRAHVQALAAIRLALDALALPTASPVEEPRWVQLELFGHTISYGLVTEVDYCGRRFLELNQPAVEVDGKQIRPGIVKRYHPNAVYAIEDRTEEQTMDALRLAANLRKWRDGSWHTERELFSVAVDENELRANELRARPEDDLPF